MAVPDYQTLMLPLLRIAAATEGETHIGAEFAQRVSKRIVLIEGQELACLMGVIKHNIGVRIKNAYEIKAVDEEYFSDDLFPGIPSV